MESLIYLVSYMPLALLRGWVLSILWAWFVVPLGVIAVSVPHAVGLSILITMLTLHKTEDKDRTTEEKIAAYVMVVIYPLMSLFFGWIWQYLMK